MMGLGGMLHPVDMVTCPVVWPGRGSEALGAVRGGVLAPAGRSKVHTSDLTQRGGERRRAADGSSKLGLKALSPGKGRPQALTFTPTS